MKVLNLTVDSGVYTSNVYLVTGSWNTISDVNTLIDVGRDSLVIPRIQNASTGVGKKRVEKVVLTHNHYDHVSLLPQIKQIFMPRVYAFSSNLEGVDNVVSNGEIIKIGDRDFEVIHTPGHSFDSICLYCKEEEVLFAGDSPLIILNKDNTYHKDFIDALIYIASKKIKIIYFGHGNPVVANCNEKILQTIQNIKD